MQGMAYIHASPIYSHGGLTSARCLIDSRWVCKVTEFGVNTFREGEEKKLSREAAFSGTVKKKIKYPHTWVMTIIIK